MLIKFDEDGLGLGGFKDLFSQSGRIQNQVNNAKNALENFSKLNFQDGINWNTLSKTIGTTDKALISYLKTCESGEATVDGFSESLQASGKGLKTLVTGFNNFMINAIAFAAITTVVKIAIEALTNYANRLENSKEALKGVQSEVTSVKTELDDTSAKIKELESFDNLSITDEEDLQRLRDQNEELHIRLKYLKDEEAIKKQEVAKLTKEQYNLKQSGRLTKEDIEAYKNLYTPPKVQSSLPDYLTGNSQPSNNILYPGQQAQNLSRESTSLAALIAQYEYYSEEKEKALTTNDIPGLNTYIELLADTKEKLIADRTELQGYRDDLQATGESSTELDQIIEKLKFIDNVLYAPGERLNDYLNDSGFTNEKEKLIELLNEGKLTASTLRDEFSGLDSYMKENGLSITDLISLLKKYKSEVTSVPSFVPLSKEEVIANINALSEGFESLDKIMSSIKDKNPFDYSLLDDKKFKETFSGLGDIYTDFIDTVSSNPKNLALTQEAFNNLVTAWLDGSGALEGLSEETAHVSEAMLTNMGITNANEIVTLALAKSKAEAAGASSNLVNASADEIVAFINTGIASDEAKEALARYALQKITTNGISLTTDGDIENVRSLVKTIGGAVTALDSFNRARQGLFDLIETSPFYQAGLDPASYHPLMQVELEQDAWEHKNAAAIKEKSQAYAESLKDAQKDVQAILSAPANYGGGNKTNKPGTSPKEKKAKDPTEFDWMEQKITLLDTQIDKLKDKIDVLVGYKGKNSTTNTAIDLMVEKMSILQQMHDKYIESANAIGLSQEYVEKIQNGTIEIESVSDENLAKQLKQYQELYKNAENCSSQIDEVTKSIHELNLSKLDNIITQFSQTLDIQNQILDTEKQILDLREKSGEAVYADDYNSLIERQLNLTRQNLQAYKELSSEMAKLNLQEGSEEWKKYNDQLQDYKNNMLAAADAVEQYKDAMTELVYKELNDLKSAMDSVNDTISTMNTLIGNTNLVDESGKLTDRGLAQVALYAQQLANSKQEAAEYAEAIQSLDEALDSGLITQDEYNSMLYEYTSAQNNAVKASKDAKDAILALVKEGIQAEIDAKKKLVDETKAALEAEQNLHDYQKSITEKQDNISRLQRAIASITSTDRESLAKKLQLQNELNKAMDELNETQYQHELEERKKALDDEYTSFEESKQKEMEELDSNLDSQEAAIKKYLEDVKNNYSSVYDILSKYGDEYSLQAIDDLTKPWESGSGAADLCSDAIGNAVSNINYEISNIDTSPLWDLVDALNSISEYGYGSNSKTNFEDISNTGKWQKGKDGKWWFGEDYREDGNYNYASGGIYSINGKQYGFDDDGYMQTEWQEHNGKQYYFDANDGHMVKSQWVPGNNGKQYYLLSDGTMAKDLAVKNGNDYYYVDKDGVWDGSTLTEEEVKALGYKTGYMNGTPNATQGWHLIDENGIGSEVVITNQGMLRQFEGGETVFDDEQVRRLWDLTNNPEKYIKDLNSMSVTQPDFSKIQPVHNTVQFNAPLFKVEGGLSSDMVGYIDGKCEWLQKNVGDLAYKDLKHKLLGK